MSEAPDTEGRTNHDAYDPHKDIFHPLAKKPRWERTAETIRELREADHPTKALRFSPEDPEVVV